MDDMQRPQPRALPRDQLTRRRFGLLGLAAALSPGIAGADPADPTAPSAAVDPWSVRPRDPATSVCDFLRLWCSTSGAQLRRLRREGKL